MNIFEGARRIGLLIAGLWAAGCIGYAVLNEPYVRLHYAINWAKSPQIVDDCALHDAREYVDEKFSNKTKRLITLCFVAVKDSSGQAFIPYAPDEKDPTFVAASEAHSVKVQEYTKRYAAEFKLPADAQALFSSRIREAYIEQIGDALKALVGGIAIGWGLIASIGWIVRGFLGVPRGEDSKPNHG